MKLTNRVAIVTGAGQGIGRAIAVGLAAEGARVLIADIDAAAGQETADRLCRGGAASSFVLTDVSDYDSVLAMVNTAQDQLGQVDILVNNAGWEQIMPFWETSPAFWDKVIGINYRGALNTCHAVCKGMMARKSGRIITISSEAGRVGSMGESVYSGCKGALIALSKTLARELAQFGITVNCVSPGPTETRLLDEVRKTGGDRVVEAIARGIPLKRLGQPEDIANAVAFLASDEAAYITGQTLSVSGGLTMC